MVYLLDADTLIRADSTYYPLKRFPVFWEWLRHNGEAGLLKIPMEQYDEIVVGRGDLVDWLKDDDIKDALVWPAQANPTLVAQVTAQGYAPDLDEAELEKVGRDPFLIAYALDDVPSRTVVTFEVSSPSKQRANRKIPDVCGDFDIPCITLFELISVLDFTTGWTPPA